MWLKNSYAITLRNDSSKNSVVITDEKPYSDAINPELDVTELARNGYTQVLITIAFDCCEIDDGYQDVEICTVSGKSLATTTVEHGSGLFASTTWGIEQCNFTISLTDLEWSICCQVGGTRKTGRRLETRLYRNINNSSCAKIEM